MITILQTDQVYAMIPKMEAQFRQLHQEVEAENKRFPDVEYVVCSFIWYSLSHAFSLKELANALMRGDDILKDFATRIQMFNKGTAISQCHTLTVVIRRLRKRAKACRGIRKEY